MVDEYLSVLKIFFYTPSFHEEDSSYTLYSSLVGVYLTITGRLFCVVELEGVMNTGECMGLKTCINYIYGIVMGNGDRRDPYIRQDTNRTFLQGLPPYQSYSPIKNQLSIFFCSFNLDEVGFNSFTPYLITLSFSSWFLMGLDVFDTPINQPLSNINLRSW